MYKSVILFYDASVLLNTQMIMHTKKLEQFMIVMLFYASVLLNVWLLYAINDVLLFE